MYEAKTPIFIVGAPRSGTTLLTAFLSNHPNLDAGPETQFFNKISQEKFAEVIGDKYWPKKAVSCLSELSLSGQKVQTLFGLSKQEMFDFLKNRKPSIQAMLEVFTECHCSNNKKHRWIEKTPNHILHLDQIRTLYPLSPIIRIVRDPRDSATSICNLPWATNSIIFNSTLVEHWYQASKLFFETDNNTLTVKYEEMIENPTIVLSNLCAFIDEKFHIEMLDTSKSGVKVASKKEPWKAMVSQELNTDRCYVWRKNMSTQLACAVSISCHNTIVDFNYETNCSPVSELTLLGTSKNDFDNFDLLSEIFAERKIKFIKQTDQQSHPTYFVFIQSSFIAGLRILLKAMILNIKGYNTVFGYYHANKFTSFLSKFIGKQL